MDRDTLLRANADTLKVLGRMLRAYRHENSDAAKALGRVGAAMMDAGDELIALAIKEQSRG